MTSHNVKVLLQLFADYRSSLINEKKKNYENKYNDITTNINNTITELLLLDI